MEPTEHDSVQQGAEPASSPQATTAVEEIKKLVQATNVVCMGLRIPRQQQLEAKNDRYRCLCEAEARNRDITTALINDTDVDG